MPISKFQKKDPFFGLFWIKKRCLEKNKSRTRKPGKKKLNLGGTAENIYKPKDSSVQRIGSRRKKRHSQREIFQKMENPFRKYNSFRKINFIFYLFEGDKIGP